MAEFIFRCSSLACLSRAQSAASISITGMAQGGTTGNPDPEVLVSVTCPAGAWAIVNGTATQGGFYAGHTNEFTCTGNPQNETVVTFALSGTNGLIFAGPASAGASLLMPLDQSQDVGTTATVTYP